MSHIKQTLCVFIAFTRLIYFQLYVYSTVIALVVGWTHLRAGFLLKLSVMFLSVIVILVVFSQAPVIQLYYENPGAK